MRQSYHFEGCYSTNFNIILRNFWLHFKIFEEILDKHLRTASTLQKAECVIPRENMSPFLTCFPHLPFGKALRAGQHSARARKSTSSHYVTRCVGAKNQSAPATSYFRLVLGTRFGRRRCSSSSVFEKVSACTRTHRTSKVRIFSRHNSKEILQKKRLIVSRLSHA